MSRIFIGLTPDNDFNQKIIALKIKQKEYKNKTAKINWVPNSNHHITVNFIGNMEPEQYNEMLSLLNELAKNLSDIPIEVDGLSYFPNENGQVLIATININKNLQKVYDKVEEVVGNVGFGMSLRSYKPHITLARFKEKNRPFTDLATLENPIKAFISTIDVYESNLEARKTKYNLLESYNLK